LILNIVIAYDVFDDKRRRKIEKLISAYGVRVNLSVFEVDIKMKDFKKLIKKLEETANKEDNIRFYILTKECIEKSFVLNNKGNIFDGETLYF